jgi:hypothetical protein
MRNSLFAAACMFFLLFATASGAVAADSDVRIAEMAVTTRIVKGNPIDAVRRISSTSVKALYCFTRIKAQTEVNTAIKHVWFHNDELVNESELPVKGTHWRTYSKRPIGRDSVGDWRVEARDSAGTILKQVKFRIN